MNAIVRSRPTTIRLVRDAPGRRLGCMRFLLGARIAGKFANVRAPNFLPPRSRRMDPAPRTEGAWMSAPKPNSADPLVAAGLPHDEVSAWLQQTPGETTDFAADRAKFS